MYNMHIIHFALLRWYQLEKQLSLLMLLHNTLPYSFVYWQSCYEVLVKSCFSFVTLKLIVLYCSYMWLLYSTIHFMLYTSVFHPTTFEFITAKKETQVIMSNILLIILSLSSETTGDHQRLEETNRNQWRLLETSRDHQRPLETGRDQQKPG